MSLERKASTQGIFYNATDNDSESYRVVWHKLGEETGKVPLRGPASALALSPGDRFVAVAVGKEIHIYSRSGHIEVIEGSVGISQLSFAPTWTNDGGYMLVSLADCVKIWYLDSHGKPYANKHQVTVQENMAVFSSDGSVMICFTQDKGFEREVGAGPFPHVTVWDVTARRLRTYLPGHSRGVRWAAVSPDSTSIAVVERDDKVRIWNAATGGCEHILDLTKACVWHGGFSPNSKCIALYGSFGIRVYAIATGAKIFDWLPCGVFPGWINWTSNRLLLATANPQETTLWDAALKDVGGRVMVAKNASGLDWYPSARFFDRGRKLMCHCNDVATDVYDTLSSIMHKFPQGTMPPVCSSDESCFLAVGQDQTLRIWKI
ncbi:YVTN repeat-like/Quino protein amine dehydrogenase [Aspergillus sclerotiicarbonarius CBS 121057]|uniref:YVTN repeat-like/Quino protein amine dehydrogenase n=1 Tax=Aspergillus sclerotiicarbonarius (strain CBS 121057 / IBT 28362) TaxID=1448318 RepID=A0A319EMZ5_ASPSB|nr:YVTN repeat-like/Quino protein amine dehydrogenase [Aspergillus sclerotiicarbonarius CBS 121057]